MFTILMTDWSTDHLQIHPFYVWFFIYPKNELGIDRYFFLFQKWGKIGIFLVSQKSFHPYFTFPPSFLDLAFAHSDIVLDNKLNIFRNTRQLMLACCLYFCSVSTEDSNSTGIPLLTCENFGSSTFSCKVNQCSKEYY